MDVLRALQRERLYAYCERTRESYLKYMMSKVHCKDNSQCKMFFLNAYNWNENLPKMAKQRLQDRKSIIQAIP